MPNLNELQDFYRQVIDRALPHIDWARPDPQRYVAEPVLVPQRWLDNPWIQLWPKLPSGEPGWPVATEPVEAAFTQILKTNGPRVRNFSDNERHEIGLAEQHCDISRLSPNLADRIMQVVVLGQVVWL